MVTKLMVLTTKIVLPEMETLTVKLLEYKQTFILPKEWLLKELPESLFASALGEDPNATSLDLTHPDVHPSVMHLLVWLAKGTEPLKHCPHLLKAHRYLNLPRLLVYGEVLYDNIPGNLSKCLDASKSFRQILLRQDKHHLYQYLLDRGYKPPSEDLALAAMHNSLNILRILLTLPMTDPSDNNYDAIRQAVIHCNFDAVKLLLTHPKANPSYGGNQVLVSAVEHGQNDFVRWLLTHPKMKIFTLIIDDSSLFYDAIRGNNLELLQMLLADKRFQLFMGSHFLEEVVELNFVDLLPALLADDRINTPSVWAGGLHRAVQKESMECLTLLLSSPRDDDEYTDMRLAMNRAAERDQMEIFKLLLSKIDVVRALDTNLPSTYRNLVLADPRLQPLRHDLLKAIQMNHYGLVALILEETKTFPEEVLSEALIMTLTNNYFHIFNLLLTDGRFDSTLRGGKLLRRAEFLSVLSNPRYAERLQLILSADPSR